MLRELGAKSSKNLPGDLTERQQLEGGSGNGSNFDEQSEEEQSELELSD
jgi:hypothetical protein